MPANYTIETQRHLDGTADYPPEARAQARALHLYLRERDIHQNEVAPKIKQPSGKPYNKASIYAFLTGANGPDNLGNITKGVARFLEIERKRAASGRAPYIETELSRTVAQACEAARTYQRIGYIVSDSQIGKSAALRQHASSTPETAYVRMPTCGGWRKFLHALAEARGIPAERRSDLDLEKDVTQTFDEYFLLIVDQAHECFRTGSVSAMRPLLWLLELWDNKGTGVVLCGTNEFTAEVQRGKHRKMMEQLWRRRSPVNLELPNTPARADLNAFAAHYGLPPATGEAYAFQKETVGRDGLGYWLTVLQAASKRAEKTAKALTWPFVQESYFGLVGIGKATAA